MSSSATATPAVADNRVELAQKLIKLTAEIRTVRFDSLNTLATKPVNFENLRKNAKSISDLRLQRRTAVIDAFEKASNVLDDKQKHKLHEFIAEWLDEAYEDERKPTRRRIKLAVGALCPSTKLPPLQQLTCS